MCRQCRCIHRQAVSSSCFESLALSFCLFVFGRRNPRKSARNPSCFHRVRIFLPKYPLARPSERWASGRRRHVLKPASGRPTSACESHLEDSDVLVGRACLGAQTITGHILFGAAQRRENCDMVKLVVTFSWFWMNYGWRGVTVLLAKIFLYRLVILCSFIGTRGITGYMLFGVAQRKKISIW